MYAKTGHEIEEIGAKLAAALKITGPFNIQCLVKDNKALIDSIANLKRLIKESEDK